MLPLLVMGLALASSGSILELAGTGSTGSRMSFQQLLTEATPVAPCYQNLATQTQYSVHKDVSLRSHLQTCSLNLVKEYHFWLDAATFPHRMMFCKVSVSFLNFRCWVSRNLAIVSSQRFLHPQTELAV